MKLSEFLLGNENYIPNPRLKSNNTVTRFAPSPTGYLHIGGLYTALISRSLANKENDIFILRIEDTDKNREIKNGATDIIDNLITFEVKLNEFTDDLKISKNGVSVGSYGPYIQSQRLHIYRYFVKLLIDKGLAYPCFCGVDDLQDHRYFQEINGLKQGYYCEHAKCRNLTSEEIIEKFNSDKPFVIRFNTKYNNLSELKTYQFTDKIKGKISITDNDMDAVLLKSDGYPTYHLAHVVDDYLMGITDVIRGDEWLNTLPLHLQLWKAFEFDIPNYGHVAPILKEDNGVKRKISKRKDPEANVQYFLELGYPITAIKEYLLNIANSDFETWRKNNPTLLLEQFDFKLNKLNKSGALFDFNKLNDISKKIIANSDLSSLFLDILTSKTLDDKLFNLIKNNVQTSTKILELNKQRKDLITHSDFFKVYDYFYDELFEEKSMPFLINAKDITEEYLKTFDFTETKQEWFDKLKNLANQFNYVDNKTYKLNLNNYNGDLTSFTNIFRLLLTKNFTCPDLFDVITILGKETVIKRLKL